MAELEADFDAYWRTQPAMFVYMHEWMLNEIQRRARENTGAAARKNSAGGPPPLPLANFRPLAAHLGGFDTTHINTPK